MQPRLLKGLRNILDLPEIRHRNCISLKWDRRLIRGESGNTAQTARFPGRLKIRAALPGETDVSFSPHFKDDVVGRLIMSSRLTVSNRQENVKVLVDFVHKWSQERGLAPGRRDTLEQAVSGIFRHLISHAYEPEQPGSIAMILEEKGPRLRLMFEDDAPAHNPTGFTSLQPGSPGSDSGPNLLNVRPLADSLIYYRTTDRKNRLVVFLTM